jgi:hypothetical protein
VALETEAAAMGWQQQVPSHEDAKAAQVMLPQVLGTHALLCQVFRSYEPPKCTLKQKSDNGQQ